MAGGTFPRAPLIPLPGDPGPIYNENGTYDKHNRLLTVANRSSATLRILRGDECLLELILSIQRR